MNIRVCVIATATPSFCYSLLTKLHFCYSLIFYYRQIGEISTRSFRLFFLLLSRFFFSRQPSFTYPTDGRSIRSRTRNERKREEKKTKIKLAADADVRSSGLVSLGFFHRIITASDSFFVVSRNISFLVFFFILFSCRRSTRLSDAFFFFFSLFAIRVCVCVSLFLVFF